MQEEKVTTRVTVDRRYSGDILCELREQFPDCTYRRLSTEENEIERILEFVIDLKELDKFVRAHRGLGPHGGELSLWKQIPVLALT